MVLSVKASGHGLLEETCTFGNRLLFIKNRIRFGLKLNKYLVFFAKYFSTFQFKNQDSD